MGQPPRPSPAKGKADPFPLMSCFLSHSLSWRFSRLSLILSTAEKIK
jgi:hypothetical protein